MTEAAYDWSLRYSGGLVCCHQLGVTLSHTCSIKICRVVKEKQNNPKHINRDLELLIRQLNCA